MKNNYITKFGCAAIWLLSAAVLTGPVFAQTWNAANIYGNWTSVAMSGDGSRIAAASFLTGLFTSTDGGTNWGEVPAPDPTDFAVLGSSANGDVLAAVFYNGGIYTSANWGTNWIQAQAPTDYWNCLASSADGARWVAGTAPGVIYTSKDSGATFTSRLPNNSYQAVAGSSNGSNLVAAVLGGKIYRSTDQGDTWAPTPAPSALWSGVAMSTNGANLAAVIQGGGIYVSSDSGNSWSVTTAPSTNWSAVACSADGSELVAAVNGGSYHGGGRIYVSADSGAHWQATSAPSNYWTSVYSSPDGTRLLAFPQTSDVVYASTNSGTDWTAQSVLSASGTTNIICTNTYSLSVICSNATSHLRTTNSFNAVYVTSSSADPAEKMVVTNAVGFNLSKATLTGTNKTTLTTSLRLSVQGNTVIGPLLLATNQFGTNVLGKGDKFPHTGKTNVVVVALPPLNGTAVFDTNLVNVVTSTVSGLRLVIRDTVNIKETLVANPRQIWSAWAASADGVKLAATVNGGFIYISANSGATWTHTASQRFWSAIASSADGARLTATVANGGIFTSTDSGATWQSNNVPNQDWSAVYSSPDGSTLVALVRDGPSWKSVNGGATWMQLNTPYDFWHSLASSADGSRLLAAAESAVYMSTNAGTSWNQVILATNGFVNCIDTFTLSGFYTNSLTVITTNVLVTTNGSGSTVTNLGSLSTNRIVLTNYFSESLAPLMVSNLFISATVLTVTNAMAVDLAGRMAISILSGGTNIVNFLATNAIDARMFGVSLGGSNLFNALVSTSDLMGTTAFINTNGLSSANSLIGISSLIDTNGDYIASPVGTNGSDIGGLVGVDGLIGNDDPVGTNGLIGINVLGSGSLGAGVIAPNVGLTNILASGMPMPFGGVHGVAFDTDFVNVISTNLFHSTNAGVTVVVSNDVNVQVSSAAQSVAAVASSADGSYLAAAVNGYIYVSTNSGATWQVTSAPNTNWTALAMSADGAQLTAAVNGGLIYTSADAGANWTAANVPVASWRAVATSANGADLVAIVNGGALYTEQSPSATAAVSALPTLSIAVANGNAVLSWPAVGADVVLQQRTSIAGAAWQDLQTTPVVVNGQNRVTLPLSSPQAVYRLRRP